jgi:hypothetical protein
MIEVTVTVTVTSSNHSLPTDKKSFFYSMCGGPAWKREIVPDHKVCCTAHRIHWADRSLQFDFVDTREFTDHGFGMRMKSVISTFNYVGNVVHVSSGL